MPELRRVLAEYDLGLLRLVGELWGQPALKAKSQREAVEELAGLMLQPEAAAVVVAGLPPEARAAFEALAQGGRQPVATFTRRHGELRAMGPARRERERPWENAPSATETLWYRGLIGQRFFNEGARLEEYLFVPDDLRALVYVGPAEAPDGAEAAGRPLGRRDEGRWISEQAGEGDEGRWTKDDEIPPIGGARVSIGEDDGRRTTDEGATLDEPVAAHGAAHDAVTLLAFMQVQPVRAEALAGPTPETDSKSPIQTLRQALLQPPALPLYLHLLRQLGLVTGGVGREVFKLDPERVQPFLQAAPGERLRLMAEAWREAHEWNDLLQMPGLVFEGTAWRNDPYTARQVILGLLRGVPPETWWSLESFVAAVKERQPDFQRPAGDYDSWYIRDAATGAYLRGFENWERVDGALVAWLIRRPMAWLGLAQVTPPGAAEAGFWLSAAGAALLGRAGWETDEGEAAGFDLRADGLVRVPAGASAYDRFQMARISTWLPLEPGPVYAYRLTPAALGRASQKGITPARIRQFLERAAPGHAALPALAAALERWERRGPEAALRDTAVLRLARPELLEDLRREARLRDLLGESLGPAAVAVRRADLGAVRAALAELGILADG
jgi:hypothetical protein